MKKQGKVGAGPRFDSATTRVAWLVIWVTCVALPDPTWASPNSLPGSGEATELVEIAGLVEKGRLDQAKEALALAIATADNAAARDLLGVILVRQGQLEEAEEQFQRAIGLDPRRLEARQHLGRLYLQTERPAQAMAALRQAAELGPLERDLALQLAAAEANDGAPGAAEAQLRSVVERFGSVRALLDLARLQARRGDQDAATQSLRQALEIAPNSEEVLSGFARISLAARAPVPAIRALEPLTRMHPSVATHAYLLGVARLQIGENEGAIESLQRSLTLQPDRAQALTALGLAYNSRKLFSEARGALARSLQVQPGNAEALAALAEAQEGLGEFEAAERSALEALAETETHAGAHLVLGKVRMNQQRYPEARDALSRAVAADPTSSKAHYQLSLAYARLGDPVASKRHLGLYRQTLREAEEYLTELRTKAGLGVSGMKR